MQKRTQERKQIPFKYNFVLYMWISRALLSTEQNDIVHSCPLFPHPKVD